MIDLLTPDQIKELEFDMNEFVTSDDVTQDHIDQLKLFADLLIKYSEVGEAKINGQQNKESNSNQV